MSAKIQISTTFGRFLAGAFNFEAYPYQSAVMERLSELPPRVIIDANADSRSVAYHFATGHRDALPLVDNERRFAVYNPDKVLAVTAQARVALETYLFGDLFSREIVRQGITNKRHIAHLHHLLDTDPMTAAGIFDKKPAMPRMTVIASAVEQAMAVMRSAQP